MADSVASPREDYLTRFKTFFFFFFKIPKGNSLHAGLIAQNEGREGGYV